MNCINHKNRDATGVCTNCGAPICDECKAQLMGAIVCPSCFKTACETYVIESKKTASLNLIYMFIAMAFYIAGWILIFFVSGLGYILLGLLLMGLPNLIFFFRRSMGIIATPSGWLWIGIFQIILGVIATPIISIMSIVRTVKAKSNEKYWQKNLDDVDCLINLYTSERLGNESIQE